MDVKRRALIVANWEYRDPVFQGLVSPARDAEELARVLGHPEMGNFEINQLLNQESSVVRESIEEFFSDSGHEDLLLLYFSGHGVTDTDGLLHFATVDTKLVRQNLRKSTAVEAAWVDARMRESRARRQVLLLDCCHSGAFAEGMRTKGGPLPLLDSHFKPQGKGRIVLTASTGTQFALEGSGGDGAQPSLYTQFLVRGIETGDADRGDGEIDVDELHDYVVEQLRVAAPHQTPTKSGYVEGQLFIARTNVVKPAELPPLLRRALDPDTDRLTGLGAVAELGMLLTEGHRGLALAAKMALDKLRREHDVGKVREAAARCLEAAEASDAAARAREEQERIAKEAAEVAQRAERERVEREKVEAARLAEQQREAEERKEASRRASEERAAREKAEAAARVERERLERERVEAARLAEQQRAAEEQKEAAERARQERAVREKAEAAARVERERVAVTKKAMAFPQKHGITEEIQEFAQRSNELQAAGQRAMERIAQEEAKLLKEKANREKQQELARKKAEVLRSRNERLAREVEAKKRVEADTLLRKAELALDIKDFTEAKKYVDHVREIAPGYLATWARGKPDIGGIVLRSLQNARAAVEPWTSNLYLAPNIPSSKLANAIRACKIADVNDVIGLIDLTLFGSAKEAVVFGKEHLYYHYMWDDYRLSWAEIERESFTQGKDGQVILRNGGSLWFVGDTGQVVPRLNALRSEILQAQL